MEPHHHQKQNLQKTLVVRSPDLGIPCRTLFLPPSLTLHLLKLSLIPQTLTLIPPPSPLLFFFTLDGKPLPDSSAVSSLPSRSLLTLNLRLSGGGGDGGATGAESRDCYLNMYAVKKPDKVDPNEARLSRWTTCALSFEPLSPPCVADRLGNVFNKEPLVHALLHKTLPKEFRRHVRGLKDMIPIHLTPNSSESSENKFHCPVTGLEFNGKYPFLAIRCCGHVLSAKALKEVKSSACLVCHKEFSELDKLVINGSMEEVAALREKMEEEEERERARVKESKEKKAAGKACLSGTKHAVDYEKGVVSENGKKDRGVKRVKAVDMGPANATSAVYASIFTSSKKSDFKETYSCRSLPLGRN